MVEYMVKGGAIKMYRHMCRCKIRGGRVTDKNLYYEGSITLDEKLMEAAGILPGEMVNVLNLNNGARITTYTITGEQGSGTICLNGPSARLFEKGDEVIVLGVSFAEEQELAGGWDIRIVQLDDKNRIKLGTK